MALLAAAAVAAGILPPVIRCRRRAGNKIRHGNYLRNDADDNNCTKIVNINKLLLFLV